MAIVRFTHTLERHVACPPREVDGGRLREVLEAAFAGNPRARGYILDDQGRARRHITIFIDGEQIADPERLTDEVPEEAEVYVMQALSGG